MWFGLGEYHRRQEEEIPSHAKVPEVVAAILDELNEGDQQAPWMRPQSQPVF